MILKEIDNFEGKTCSFFFFFFFNREAISVLLNIICFEPTKYCTVNNAKQSSPCLIYIYIFTFLFDLHKRAKT